MAIIILSRLSASAVRRGAKKMLPASISPVIEVVAQMSRVFQPLLFLLARSAHEQLARQVESLKAENEILRKRVP